MSLESQLPAGTKRLFKETKVRADIRGAVGSCVYLCAWDDVPKAINVIGGLPQSFGPFGLTRIVPLQFPDWAGQAFLWAESADVDGVGHNRKASPNGHYSHAKIKVSFKSYFYDFDPNTAFTTVSLEPAPRSMIGPASGYLFSGGSVRPQQDIGEQVAGTQIKISLFRLGGLNYPLYASLANCVNNGAFLGYADGTLKYMGPGENITTTIVGQTTYQITHSFLWSAVPWNYEFLPGTGVPTPLFYADGVTLRYPAVDFNPLFL